MEERQRRITSSGILRLRFIGFQGFRAPKLYRALGIGVQSTLDCGAALFATTIGNSEGFAGNAVGVLIPVSGWGNCFV